MKFFNKVVWICLNCTFKVVDNLLDYSVLSGQPGEYGGILGMAFVGTVCSVSTSGGINVVSFNF